VSADGSAFRRLTTDPASDSAPAWSPNGAGIAFATYRYATVEWPISEIALMEADGSNVLRTAAAGERPSWSPDGAQITFHAILPADLSEWPPPPTEIVVGVMNLQDGGVSHIESGFDVAWRPHGANLHPVPSIGVTCQAHVCSFYAFHSVDPDGSITSYLWDFGDGTTGTGAGVAHTYPSGTPYIATLTVSDDNGATASLSRTVEPNAPPFAYATVTCNGRTCSFDGSGSADDGTIVSYRWTFGDGMVGSGATVIHTYATPGFYPISLTVTDNEGATAGPFASTALASTPPIASFTFTCNGLACVFDASTSTDPDGTVARYEWAIDGRYPTGPIVSHTFAVPGQYLVLLIVRDNLGLSDERRTNITVPYDTAHLADLDGASTTQQNVWHATVTLTVHDSRHAVVSGALVTGLWSDGTSATCTTNGDGQCAVSRSGIPRRIASVGFSVTNVTRPAFVYKPADNHDPDGSSSGTTISISKP
jgi:PKD repeat protein